MNNDNRRERIRRSAERTAEVSAGLNERLASRERVPTRRTQRETSRFWSKVRLPENADGCMYWAAYTNQWGYGQFTNRYRRHVFAHRYSYELAYGPIPDGYQVDHLCGTPGCVRPDHLEAVPGHVNNARSNSPSAVNARKTQCPQGHPYDDENTYEEQDGHRACRTCRRAAVRKWRATRAALEGEQ